jgi:hypothetical protein
MGFIVLRWSLSPGRAKTSKNVFAGNEKTGQTVHLNGA